MDSPSALNKIYASPFLQVNVVVDIEKRIRLSEQFPCTETFTEHYRSSPITVLVIIYIILEIRGEQDCDAAEITG